MSSAIILDCDPGHDDVFALLLAYGHPDVDLLAVTTVAGNQTLEKVTHNALSVARVAGFTGVPFAAGCDRPLVREAMVAADVHGESGLDGPDLPEPVHEVDSRHAIDLIIDEVMSREPHTVTLVPTGALTNIAMAVRKEPALAERVKEVVLMGGGYHQGNWSPVAEYNIAVDPESAHIVFNAGWQVLMVGLDVTHQALATPGVVERITALDTGPSRFAVELLDFFGEMYKDTQGFDSPPVHDPCAVAYVIDPTVMTVRRTPVDIELHGSLTTGMTVADFRAPAPRDCRTSVATSLDHSVFWDMVVESLERIGEVEL
ncbi:MAG: nucleoside hydrolase [Ornithinimicrobium sp.]